MDNIFQKGDFVRLHTDPGRGIGYHTGLTKKHGLNKRKRIYHNIWFRHPNIPLGQEFKVPSPYYTQWIPETYLEPAQYDDNFKAFFELPQYRYVAGYSGPPKLNNIKMNWYKKANVQSIKQSLLHWGKAYNIPESQLIQIINQIEQEEQQLLNSGFFNTEQDKRYSKSLWARQRFQELLGIQKQQKHKQQTEDPLINKAKGINQKYWEWVLKQLKSSVYDFDQSVFDYFNANGINPQNLSYQEAKRQSDQWHEEKYHTKEKMKYRTPVTAGEPVFDMFMVEITKEDQKAEGKNMQNCIGDQCLVSENNKIYSLRDRKNNPHVSIQVENGLIQQIKGKQNSQLGGKKNPESKKYIPYVIEWIKNHPEIKIENLDSMPISEENFHSLIDNFANYDDTMAYAAEKGYIDIVKLLIEKGPPYYNLAMHNAAKNDHTNIIKLMLEKGATDHYWAMNWAAKNDHIDIVKLLIEKGATEYSRAMYLAASNGHIDIIKLLLGKDTTDYYWIMDIATKYGHINIVKLIKKYMKNKKASTNNWYKKAKYHTICSSEMTKPATDDKSAKA